EHEVEVRIDELARPVVVLLLVRASADEQIAHAGRDDRPRRSPRLVEQRNQLLLEFAAAKRKQLDDDDRRSNLQVRLNEKTRAFTADVFERVGAVQYDDLSVGILRERRKLDDVDALRRCERSEERRVGKEGRCRGWSGRYKMKEETCRMSGGYIATSGCAHHTPPRS